MDTATADLLAAVAVAIGCVLACTAAGLIMLGFGAAAEERADQREKEGR